MIRKLLICPWFGPLPDWFPLWERNVARLADHGFDVLVTTDLPAFKQRVHDQLGVDCPIVEGEGKIHDYRCTFGHLFAEELDEGRYDFWGHTDFDVVYGRVERWVTDEFLAGLDIHSNHIDYMSGPWSLYRNQPSVNRLYRLHPDWRRILEDPTSTGWVEKEFTYVVDEAHVLGRIRRVYTMWQTHNLDDFDGLHWYGDALVERARHGPRRDGEVMMAHFRRTKEYPKGAIR